MSKIRMHPHPSLQLKHAKRFPYNASFLQCTLVQMEFFPPKEWLEVQVSQPAVNIRIIFVIFFFFRSSICGMD